MPGQVSPLRRILAILVIFSKEGSLGLQNRPQPRIVLTVALSLSGSQKVQKKDSRLDPGQGGEARDIRSSSMLKLPRFGNLTGNWRKGT